MESVTITVQEVWSYRDRTHLGFDPTSGRDITGFDVQALDGSIGKVDEANHDSGRSSLIVDTGPWIFGKKVMLPAGVIQKIDDADEKVWVNRTKDEIKQAPEYDEALKSEPGYHTDLANYYGYGGLGYRDWGRTL